MKLNCELNGRAIAASISPDTMLLQFLRDNRIYSVKGGCETSNCGLCTVWVDDVPVLSCSYPAARVAGKKITTLEGVQQEAAVFAEYMAQQGAEQCGYCSPGFIMSVLAMEKELENPSEEAIKHYLAGCLCRCTGYTSHMRALKGYLERGENA